MASWPEKTRLIGTNIPRLDGLAKASGKAKYPSDVRPEGTLFGVMLYSPHAHAKIKSIDASAAEKMPGVKAVNVIAQAGKELRYQGEDIAAVAAETEEQARDAIHAIKVEYDVLPHAVTEAQAVAEGAPKLSPRGNLQKGASQRSGFPGKAQGESDEDYAKKLDGLIAEAFGGCAAVIEGSYSVPVITHVCLEPHGLTARWDGEDKITAWASTQAVQPTANELAGSFSIPVANVTVLTEVMGGGFGSKFGADLWGVTAARLSKIAGGKPVKMFLDRTQEHLAAGNRPSASGKIKFGADKNGKLAILVAETQGTAGVRPGSGFPFPYVYRVAKVSRSHNDVFVNGGGARAMRAPGHPQACFLMESAMDDLADKLGVDPLTFRVNNLPPDDFRTKIYIDEINIGAEKIGWDQRKPRGQGASRGPIRHGYGMALHTWGGGPDQSRQVACTINPDGSVEVKSATQDIGTGARTVLAIIVAEVLGLQPTDVTSNIGNSTFPSGQPSGGSTTTPSMSAPCYNAATQVRDKFLEAVAKAAGKPAGDLSLKDGKVFAGDAELMSFKDACRKLGMNPISVTAGFTPGLTSSGVGGVQFAHATVDMETGVVRLKKIVAVQDTGLIIDMLTWKSQVFGGVIGGLNYALFEERILDEGTGRMLNPDMEMYKLAGASDVPEIIVEAYHTPEMRARGVIGVGEPPTIGTAAAIANAVTNAVGVRVPTTPLSPMNVLNALASASKS